jgi:hypothetical protein
VTTAAAFVPTMVTSLKIFSLVGDERLEIKWVAFMVGLSGMFSLSFLKASF